MQTKLLGPEDARQLVTPSPLNHSYHQVELLCLGVYWKLPNQKPPLSCDAHCTGTDFRSDQTRSVRARLYRHSRVIVHCNALVPWIKIIIVITIIIVNHCQVGRCQRLRSRRVVASGTGAMPELCWKSATASQSVARLRPLEEACTTGSTEALVKLKCIKTQQSLATVHRRSFPFWPLIPNTKACIQFYREKSQIKSLLFLGLEANQGCLYLTNHFACRAAWWVTRSPPNWRSANRAPRLTVISLQIAKHLLQGGGLSG